MSNSKLNQSKEAHETFQNLMEISELLGINLDAETLSICLRLCESGINPELLALIITELQKEITKSSDKQN